MQYVMKLHFITNLYCKAGIKDLSMRKLRIILIFLERGGLYSLKYRIGQFFDVF